MKDSLCSIKWHTDIGGGYRRLGFVHEVGDFQPGQFVMVKIPSEEILLRRPFSLCQKKEKAWEIVYKVVGNGTRILSSAKVGDSIEVLGPLGNPFSLPEKKEYCFIAGGYGIAPFLRFSQVLRGRNKKISLFYGAQTKDDLLLKEDFASQDVTLHYATEDGSEGYQGLVTELFEEKLKLKDKKDVVVAACGPHGLLSEVTRICQKHHIPCEVSMESTMGCGSGVCLGCVVETKDHQMVRTCQEGPVFDATTLLWG